LGYKISIPSAYRHISEGKLGRPPFSSIGLRQYGDLYLKRKSGTPSSSETTEDATASARKLAAQAEVWEIKAQILRGEYVERSIHERALAMRAARLKSDGENDFRNNASEAVRLVDGDITKLPDLIDWLLQLLETWLDRYSADVEFDLPAGVDLEKL